LRSHIVLGVVAEFPQFFDLSAYLLFHATKIMILVKLYSLGIGNKLLGRDVIRVESIIVTLTYKLRTCYYIADV
jgi:hypothetical protein